jgi:hypothetical protein
VAGVEAILGWSYPSQMPARCRTGGSGRAEKDSAGAKAQARWQTGGQTTCKALSSRPKRGGGYSTPCTKNKVRGDDRYRGAIDCDGIGGCYW